MENPWLILNHEGRRKYTDDPEFRRFLQSALVLPQRERLFCQLLALSGCRISEALGMQGFHIAKGAVVLRTLKRRKTVFRIVELPEWLAEELTAFAAELAPDQPLWPVIRSTAYRWVKRAMRMAQIAGIQACPKGLRHGFGVRYVMNDVPLPPISEWLGHASVKTTMIYTAARGPQSRALAMRGW